MARSLRRFELEHHDDLEEAFATEIPQDDGATFAGCTTFRVDGGALAGGTLLVASDGLLKYASPNEIARVVAGGELATVAHALVDLVRLRSGDLQDDVSIVLCRSPLSLIC